MSIVCILLIAAFVGTLLNATTGKVPLWVCVLLLNIAALISCLSLR